MRAYSGIEKAPPGDRRGDFEVIGDGVAAIY
jgi:hypothetical protein